MKSYITRIIYYLFILTFSLLFSNSYSQEIPELELKFQQGLSLISQGNLAAAENIFNSLKSHKAYKAKAYLGLGLVTREKPMQLINAMNYFKIALKIDKNFLFARYELAKTAGMENTYRAGMPDLENILEKNPDYLDSYDIYINAGWYYREEKRLIKSLNMLINKYPDRERYYYDLAETYIRDNKLDNASEVLSKWSQHPNFAEQFRYYYLFSKISFLDNEDKTGLSYYWKSIDLLTDSLDVKTLLRDMVYIFDDTDLDTLLDSPVEKIKSYLRKFWKERDPDILTEENERIPEHFRRIKIAREKYRRMYQCYNPQQVLLDGSEKKLPVFVQTFTDNAASVPDVTLRYAESLREAKLLFDPKSISSNFRISDSFKIQSDLDDAGFIYVRHGEPDAFVWNFTESTKGADAHTLVTKGFKTTFDNMIKNMSWLYFPKKGQARMLLHFNQYYSSLGYELSIFPFSFEDRETLEPRYYRMDVARIEELKEESKIDIMHATIAEASSITYGGEPIEFSLAMFSFKDKPDSNQVFFYFPNHINPNKAYEVAHENKLLYLYAIQFFDKSGYLRFEKNVSKSMNISGLPMKDSPVTIFNLMDFRISPGNYTVKFAMKDVYQEMGGEYKGKINLVPFPEDTLMLSDLIYGIRKENPAPTYFNRNGVIIQPWNFFTIKKEIPLTIYFEIYNLNLDETGYVNYEVEYQLKSKKGKRILNFLEQKQRQIGSKYQVMGVKSDEFFTLDLKLPQNVKGQYLLDFIVKDLISGKSAGREVPLEVE